MFGRGHLSAASFDPGQERFVTVLAGAVSLSNPLLPGIDLAAGAFDDLRFGEVRKQGLNPASWVRRGRRSRYADR
jgi:hypothetical protein